ncbi:unnamed protein product, partial [Rotaria sordida]
MIVMLIIGLIIELVDIPFYLNFLHLGIVQPSIPFIFFPPCKNTFDYTLPVCNNYPCYLDNLVLGIWDSVMNSIIPTFVVCISSVTIVIRVHYQKRRLVNQRNQWR